MGDTWPQTSDDSSSLPTDRGRPAENLRLELPPLVHPQPRPQPVGFGAYQNYGAAPHNEYPAHPLPTHPQNFYPSTVSPLSYPMFEGGTHAMAGPRPNATMASAIESALWSTQPPLSQAVAGGMPPSGALPHSFPVMPPTAESMSFGSPQERPYSGTRPVATVGDFLKSMPPTAYSGGPLGTQRDSLVGRSITPPTPAVPKPFISILHSILANPSAYGDCLVWDEPGTSFIVSHQERLIKEVLPHHFQHSNLQSFTRQLNVYEFTRLPTPRLLEMLDLTQATSNTSFSGWSHPSFLRDDASRLATMKPRPSRARQQKKVEKEAAKAKAREEQQKRVAAAQEFQAAQRSEQQTRPPPDLRLPQYAYPYPPSAGPSTSAGPYQYDPRLQGP